MHKITIAHTEKILMNVLGPISHKRSHAVFETNLALDLFYMHYSSYANTMNYLHVIASNPNKSSVIKIIQD